MEVNTTYNMDAIEAAKLLPDQCVDCIVTSPPYYGLRDYGVDGQIGLEETTEQYIQKLVELFRELRRVLKREGTLWVNIGDGYAGSGRGVGGTKRSSEMQRNNVGSWVGDSHKFYKSNEVKPKDLIGIPWMLAFALRADGWYLRQDIIWSKPNPMPESVTDRCTKSHEYIFLFSKSAKYYFDAEAISKECSPNTHARISQDLANQIGSHRAYGGKKTNGPMKAVSRKTKLGQPRVVKNNPSFDNACCMPVTKRNKRSVWTVTTKPFKEAHFATYPEDLIVDCIKAGCPSGGVVLDPFMGAGTTAVVARKLNRNYIGFELNPDYIKIADKRLHNEIGLFR